MYDKIYKFAVDRRIKVEKNAQKRKIAGYILLDSDGEYEGIESCSEDKGKKRALCPNIPISGYVSIICAKKGYIIPDKKTSETAPRKKTTNEIKHDQWLSIMKEGAENTESLKPVWKFIDKLEKDPEFAKSVKKDLSDAEIKDDAYISFRVEEKNLEKQSEWKEWFDTYVKRIKAQIYGAERTWL